MADISKNIKRMRMELGLSQQQLAEQIGVTRQTISSWERGASFPDLGIVEKLTSALGTDLPHLLDPNAAHGRKGRRVEPLFGYGSIVHAVILYIVAYVLLVAIFEPIFGNAAGIIVAVLLFVVLIVFCTCLIMKHITACTASFDRAEEDNAEDSEPSVEEK